MGSEMCIRDRHQVDAHGDLLADFDPGVSDALDGVAQAGRLLFETCLLYTSDAADERSSVDLGGRRIIKKKKREHLR